MIHAEEVRCPCRSCQVYGQETTGHRVIRYYFDDEKEPSPEVQAMLDEIIKDCIASAQRRSGES